MSRYTFKLPDVGEGIAEAEIVAWHVKPGDRIEEDQPLVDVMTDKATVEITSPVAGTVVSLDGELGVAAAVGSVIAVLMTEGGGRDSDTPIAGTAAPPESPSPDPAPGPPDPPAPEAEIPTQGVVLPPAPPVDRARGLRPLASPAVRRQATALGVHLPLVPGSGPAGRIRQADLDAYLADPAASQVQGRAARPVRHGVETIKVLGLRRRISERMSEAKRRIPHFSYIEEIDVTDLDALRVKLNALYPEQPRLTILPFLARALVRSLPDFPQINATFDDDADEVHRHAAVHLGVATQTPGGLVVPVVRHAEALDVWETAREIARLADVARSGKASREELSGSSITITSLGPLGGLATTPVINRPEVAIIGPNRIIERPVIVAGEIAIRKMMNLSSSFDHRVVDGWDAAEFVQRLKRLLESPALLFVEAP